MGIACNGDILVGDPFTCVNENQCHITAIKTFKCLDNGVFFYALPDLSLSADTRRVNEPKGLAIFINGQINGVPGGARLFTDHHPFGTKQTIDQGRFSHIGPSCHGNAYFLVCRCVSRTLRGFEQHVIHQHSDQLIHKGGNPHPMFCRYGEKFIHSQGKKISKLIPLPIIFNFINQIKNRLITSS